jgi:5-methylcytosine-specific restriction endonuclease McrA
MKTRRPRHRKHRDIVLKIQGDIRRETRRRLYRAQGGLCCYCRRRMTLDNGKGSASNPAAATIDHVRPTAAGGTNDAGNLVAACWSCNQAKGCGVAVSETTYRRA